MARRSPNDPIVLTARLPIGEAGWWTIIKRLDDRGPWSVPDIDGEVSTPSKGSIGKFVLKLNRAGIAKLMRVGRTRYGRPKKFYRLTRKPHDAPRLRDDGKPAAVRSIDAMWRAIRATRQFTQRDIAFAASVDRTVPASTAQWYCNQLLAAGYLVEMPRRARNAPPHYRLKPAMNTGPKAPHILEVKAVWDPNLRKVMGEGRIAKEAA